MPQNYLEEFEKSMEERNAPMVSRFLNLIIDSIVIQITLVIVFAFLLVSNQFQLNENGEIDDLSFYAIVIFVFISYYTLLEVGLGGRTIGKMITKTRAVTLEGAELNFLDGIKRSLSRLVPFEFLSIFFGENEMWHDSWTNTKVVKY